MQPAIIPATTDVLNGYSVRQSLRRGSTMQARNKKVPKDVVDLNNRWRADDAAGNHEACGFTMLETFTDVLVTIEALLQYLKHCDCPINLLNTDGSMFKKILVQGGDLGAPSLVGPWLFTPTLDGDWTRMAHE
ncbi:hypothetical protein ACA910_020685 [Epithemia clementina (nom. ined.)]